MVFHDAKLSYYPCLICQDVCHFFAPSCLALNRDATAGRYPVIPSPSSWSCVSTRLWRVLTLPNCLTWCIKTPVLEMAPRCQLGNGMGNIFQFPIYPLILIIYPVIYNKLVNGRWVYHGTTSVSRLTKWLQSSPATRRPSTPVVHTLDVLGWRREK